jgi:hypothetical protein
MRLSAYSTYITARLRSFRSNTETGVNHRVSNAEPTHNPHDAARKKLQEAQAA